MSETDDDALIAALWRVVADHGWAGLTVGRLSADAAIPVAALRSRLPSRLDALLLHLRLVDRAVVAGTVPGQGGAARDRVFDVMMRRCDALQPNRAGLVRFLGEMRRDPGLGAVLLPHVASSMRAMLDAAEIGASGPQRAALAVGLLGVWLAALRAWVEDDSEDLAPTMAALDRALDRAEQIGRTFRLLTKSPAAAEQSSD